VSALSVVAIRSPPAYTVIPLVSRVITPVEPVTRRASAAAQFDHLLLFVQKYRFGFVPP
jgi:hypothetical protein